VVFQPDIVLACQVAKLVDREEEILTSAADPRAMRRKHSVSRSDPRALPSTIFVGTDATSRRSCSVNP
jgi:hypothetical protein